MLDSLGKSAVGPGISGVGYLHAHVVQLQRVWKDQASILLQECQLRHGA